MDKHLRRCLADGSGHWEPQPGKVAPYELSTAPRLSHYAPQACDKPGRPSTRAALQYSWVPGGPSCGGPRQRRSDTDTDLVQPRRTPLSHVLNQTLEVLAALFCERHNGSRILLVGDSIMSQWFLGLAASLGQPTFAAPRRACNGTATRLDYEVGQSAVACGGHVHVRYVRNGVLDVNVSASLVRVRLPLTRTLTLTTDPDPEPNQVSAEAAARASRGACVADPASTNQPWLYWAAKSDFVVLNRGVWVEADDARFVSQVNRTLRAVRAAGGPRNKHMPRVVWRGTPASIPRCWQLPDPQRVPVSFNLSANPALAAERGVALFKWHRFAPRNTPTLALALTLSLTLTLTLTLTLIPTLTLTLTLSTTLILTTTLTLTRFAPQNALARSLVEAEGHSYLDTYQQTALRPGGHHRSRHDCVHWCLPGPPDEWTRLLLLIWLHGAGSTFGGRD